MTNRFTRVLGKRQVKNQSKVINPLEDHEGKRLVGETQKYTKNKAGEPDSGVHNNLAKGNQGVYIHREGNQTQV